jgi:hypothetical protein
MDNSLKRYLHLNESFDKIVQTKRKLGENPSIAIFLSPGFGIFDIYRLVKLAKFSASNFEVIIILMRSSNEKLNEEFKYTINKMIPKNKTIISYEDLLADLYYNSDFLNFIDSLKLKNLYYLLKFSKGQRNLSFMNLLNFVSEYYILRRGLLGIETDFVMLTDYKSRLFREFPEFEVEKLPSTILLPDIYFDWNFKENITKLERIISRGKINRKQIQILSEDFTLSFKELFIDDHQDNNLILQIKKIKDFLFRGSSMGDYFVLRENYAETISALNNNLRREIISTILANEGIKAEEIRKLLREKGMNYTLVNILKHLSILKKAGFVKKEQRRFYLKSNRVLMNMPFSWFG